MARLLYHTGLRQMVEVVGETATHYLVKHPQYRNVVESPKDLYDPSVRRYQDLDKRAEVARRDQERRDSPTVPFRMRIGSKWVVFLVPEIVGRDLKAGVLTPCTFRGPADIMLVDLIDRRYVAQGLHRLADPWRIMEEYDQATYMRVTRIPWIEHLPHRVLTPTPIVQVIVGNEKPIPALLVRSTSKTRWTVELLADPKRNKLLRKGTRLVTRPEFVQGWPSQERSPIAETVQSIAEAASDVVSEVNPNVER